MKNENIIQTENEVKKLIEKYSQIDSAPESLKEALNTYAEKLSVDEIISENKIEDSEEYPEEYLNDVVEKINNLFAELNFNFLKLVKEEEVTEIKSPKIKYLKPKAIKIPRLTYKKIKAHCTEHNIDIEKWIEKISLNEINRIIIRVGDIDYKKENKTKKKL